MPVVSMAFINYRRRDDAYAAAFLDDALSREFGSDRIFRAGRSIPAGTDYEQSIMSAIGRSHVMLVLVGPDWAKLFKTATSDMEWVHREIGVALERKIPVVPILLAGASRLSQDCLPSDIATLACLQYLRFDYRNTIQDLTYIASELRRLIPDIGSSSRPHLTLAQRLFGATKRKLGYWT